VKYNKQQYAVTRFPTITEIAKLQSMTLKMAKRKVGGCDVRGMVDRYPVGKLGRFCSRQKVDDRVAVI
jgi:hypothetical protein